MGNKIKMSKVKYHGREYVVPHYIKYISTNANGRIFGWVEKPEFNNVEWVPGGQLNMFFFVGHMGSNDVDHKKSLVEL